MQWKKMSLFRVNYSIAMEVIKANCLFLFFKDWQLALDPDLSPIYPFLPQRKYTDIDFSEEDSNYCGATHCISEGTRGP